LTISTNRPEVLLRGGSGKVEENFTSEKHETHRDERQVLLDTDRSFVLYPVGELIYFNLKCPESDIKI
jgi:hypothetical protein